MNFFRKLWWLIILPLFIISIITKTKHTQIANLPSRRRTRNFIPHLSSTKCYEQFIELEEVSLKSCKRVSISNSNLKKLPVGHLGEYSPWNNFSTFWKIAWMMGSTYLKVASTNSEKSPMDVSTTICTRLLAWFKRYRTSVNEKPSLSSGSIFAVNKSMLVWRASCAENYFFFAEMNLQLTVALKNQLWEYRVQMILIIIFLAIKNKIYYMTH